MGKRFPKQTIRDIDLYNRTVLVRTDYNVPLTKNGDISDDLRIRASLPTIKYLLEQHCKVIIMSHLGRPQGRDSQLSLRPVAARLSELLGQSVGFIDDCVGDSVRQAVRRTPRGGVLMLENLRFYQEEEMNDLIFAKSIQRAVRADYFVQDGFGVSHRAHASTDAITLCVPSVAGLLLEKEYTTITEVMNHPKSPVVAIVGGAKVSDKIALIDRLMGVADKILVGGAMANVFLQYRGHNIGNSVCEPGQKEVIDKIYAMAAKKVGLENVDNFLLLPSDVAVAADKVQRREVAVDRITDGEKVLDIGSRTIERFTEVLRDARTVIWNGPMGLVEDELFAIGSARIALAIAQNKSITSIVGGGDTADFILKWDGHDGASFTHVSTGGGASMELMVGKKLPGIESLLDVHEMR